MNLSCSGFHNRFLKETGFSPHEYITRRRIELAKEQITTTNKTLTDIAYDCGFPTSQHFAGIFKRHTGLTPSDFRLWRRRNAKSRAARARDASSRQTGR
jgi:AraC-like DNA-binding protein